MLTRLRQAALVVAESLAGGGMPWIRRLSSPERWARAMRDPDSTRWRGGKADKGRSVGVAGTSSSPLSLRRRPWLS